MTYKTVSSEASNELRTSRLAWKRLRRLLVDGALVVTVASATALYVSGAGLLLRADGTVTRERVAIAVPYEGRVTQVFVHPGDAVETGQKIAVVESSAIIRTLSEISAEKARISSRIAQIEARRAVVESLTPFTEVTARQARLFLDALVKAGENGSANHKPMQEKTSPNLTPAERQANYLEEALIKAGRNIIVNNKFILEMTSANLSATERAISLKAEQTSLATELKANLAALDELNTAHANLKRIYNDGVLYATASGTIGSKVGAVGQVLASGQAEFADVHSGKNFVLAYMPENYLFSIEEGQAVVVDARNQTLNAHIEKILLITDALPPEFQSLNKAGGREQLVRISFDEDQSSDPNQLAVGQKIRVRGCYTSDCRGEVLLLLRKFTIAMGEAIKKGLLGGAGAAVGATKKASFEAGSDSEARQTFSSAAAGR
jgi:multidrug efflux pump subunit AcrA (membrane-fusion protein)